MAVAALSTAAMAADASKDAGRHEVPALPPEQALWSGKVEQDFTLFNEFAYGLQTPAGKIRLEFVKAELVKDESAGLYVTAVVDGKRQLILEWRDINAGNRTYLLVKPLKKKKALGVAIMSDWGGGPDADRAAEIGWDGKKVVVKDNVSGAWAK